MNLNGASCVITGAGRGLGAALCRELVARGARPLLSDLESPDLRELAKELGQPFRHCEDKHDDYDASMEPANVAKLIAENLAHDEPAEHLEIWSAADVRRRAA